MDRVINKTNEAYVAAERIIDMVKSAGFDITNPYSIINADWSMLPADMMFNYGASRLVIWDEDYCDYVIKIPLKADYEKYCQHEVEIYNAAVKEGLADSFAWCACYAEPTYTDGKIDTSGIYVMEYVYCDGDTNSDDVWIYGYQQYCSERGLDSSSYDYADEYNEWSYNGVDEDLTLDYVESYIPGELIRAFVVFMSKWHITDIHTENIGRIGNRVVMLDYAGWNW